MARAGGVLASAIVVTTILALGVGLLWGRLFGLPRSHALLVASGNAICGNSAIAAVASVIGANREETASAVAYTAILSLALVLVLPFVRAWLALDDLSYGVATGLTVYAVPQVLAAAYPVSVQAGQVGTVVKLVASSCSFHSSPSSRCWSARWRTTKPSSTGACGAVVCDGLPGGDRVAIERSRPPFVSGGAAGVAPAHRDLDGGAWSRGGGGTPAAGGERRRRRRLPLSLCALAQW
jgi:hypothetical protein